MNADELVVKGFSDELLKMEKNAFLGTILKSGGKLAWTGAKKLGLINTAFMGMGAYDGAGRARKAIRAGSFIR